MCKSFWPCLLLCVFFASSAMAQKMEGDNLPDPTPAQPKKVTTGQTSVGAVVNDSGLTKSQLDMIEDMVQGCMDIPAKAARATCLRATYDKRKDVLAQNNTLAQAGKPVGNTMTQDEYVERYGIPAITPKLRSDVNRCEFNTLKDNWLDASNLQRNAELFVRAFEVSYSGVATQDLWHLPGANGTPNPANIYTRAKALADVLRENRNQQKNTLAYVDLMMACQCLYTFGPEKFDQAKQTFFFTMCTGSAENKICRDGDQRESFKLASSDELAYRNGVEFPNYVEMYLNNLQKTAGTRQNSTDDISNTDASAAGISHEEVLVRWLSMRACNQTDVFVDTEKLEGDTQSLVDDIHRAKLANPKLTAYWQQRLQQMKNNGVDPQIIQHFQEDNTKDTYFRGYVDTETKVSSYKVKKPKFLLFFLNPIAFFVDSSKYKKTPGLKGIMDATLGDFPVPIIEDRIVQKKSCTLGLYWCITYHRILHWPAYSNGPGLENAFPFNKKEERTCDQTLQIARSLPGISPNPCSGMFKGTMCTRGFYAPVADQKIANVAKFAPWGELMKDKMLMDPAFPAFYEDGGAGADMKWKEAVNDGFRSGCAWAQSIGKKAVVPADQLKFFPDMSKWMDGNGKFLASYQFNQPRIDKYKEAVAKYALCDNLLTCGLRDYHGQASAPRGFVDIVENQEQADLFANYVYQIHYNWRHMSGSAGIGYPLSYLESYFQDLAYQTRLLTTLTIRRGIENNAAATKYGEDLAKRYQDYQIGDGDYGGKGKNYGLKPGEVEGADTPVQMSNYWGQLAAITAWVAGSVGPVNTSGALAGKRDASLASNSSLKGTVSSEQDALLAAQRHAERLAQDNKKLANYKTQMSGDASGLNRAAAAASFFGNLNSPASGIAGMGSSQGSASASGMSGSATGPLNARPGHLQGDDETTPEVTHVKGAGAATGNTSGAPAWSNQGGADGQNGFGGNLNGGFDPGLGGATATSERELNEAARMTGLGSGEVRTMLDEANREKHGKGSLVGNEDDGLFDKVSKAYMRNLELVLTGKKTISSESKKPVVQDKDKEELRQILR